MFSMGVPELIIVGVIAVLLFGKRLPDVARSLGQSYHQFRSGLRDLQRELDSAAREADRPLYQRSPSLPYHADVSGGQSSHAVATSIGEKECAEPDASMSNNVNDECAPQTAADNT